MSEQLKDLEAEVKAIAIVHTAWSKHANAALSTYHYGYAQGMARVIEIINKMLEEKNDD